MCLGSPVVPFYQLALGRFPLHKIDYRKGYPILTSLLEDLGVSLLWDGMGKSEGLS